LLARLGLRPAPLAAPEPAPPGSPGSGPDVKDHDRLSLGSRLSSERLSGMSGEPRPDAPPGDRTSPDADSTRSRRPRRRAVRVLIVALVAVVVLAGSGVAFAVYEQSRIRKVDLTKPGVVDVLADLDARIIGFANHTSRDVMDAARAAGCQQVLARSDFFARIDELLA